MKFRWIGVFVRYSRAFLCICYCSNTENRDALYWWCCRHFHFTTFSASFVCIVCACDLCMFQRAMRISNKISNFEACSCWFSGLMPCVRMHRCSSLLSIFLFLCCSIEGFSCYPLLRALCLIYNKDISTWPKNWALLFAFSLYRISLLLVFRLHFPKL